MFMGVLPEYVPVLGAGGAKRECQISGTRVTDVVSCYMSGRN